MKFFSLKAHLFFLVFLSCGHEDKKISHTEAMGTSAEDNHSVFIHSEPFVSHKSESQGSLDEDLEKKSCIYTGSFQKEEWQENLSFATLNKSKSEKVSIFQKEAWVSRHTPYPVNLNEIINSLDKKSEPVDRFMKVSNLTLSSAVVGLSFFAGGFPAALFTTAALGTVAGVLKFGETLKESTLPSHIGELTGEKGVLGMEDTSRYHIATLDQIQQMVYAIDGAKFYLNDGQCPPIPKLSEKIVQVQKNPVKTHTKSVKSGNRRAKSAAVK